MPLRKTARLASLRIAPERQVVVWTATNSTAADATFAVFRAPRAGSLRKATYTQTAAATAVTSFTATLKNGAVAMTNALDIKALGANGSADFAMASESARRFKAGDVLTIFFDETGGTVTAPGFVTVCLELALEE